MAEVSENVAHSIARRNLPEWSGPFAAFYHIACMGNWRDVVQEQLAIFREVGLQPSCVVLGTKDESAWIESLGLQVIEQIPDILAFEIPTLVHVKNWAIANPDGAVLYCHTKGVSQPACDIKATWRALMNESVIRHYRELLRTLAVADAAGANLHAGAYSHFHGNFWVARSSLLRVLPDPVEFSYDSNDWRKYYGGSWRRCSAEVWIGRWAFLPHSVQCRDQNWLMSNIFNADFPYCRHVKAIEQRLNEYGSNYIPSFGGTWTGGVRLQQIPIEFARFLAFMQKLEPITSYLEIGSAAGGTVRAIGEFLAVKSVFVIDDGNHPDAYLFGENTKYIPSIERVLCDSHSEQARKSIEGKTFDLAGIDGDHSYEGVKADWEMVKDHIRPGGWVWFHDTVECEGVRQFVDELEEQGSLKLILRTDVGYYDVKMLGIHVFQLG
jgi:hypothetical protein